MKLFALTATLAASKSTRNESNRPQPQSAAKPKFLEESSHSHSLDEGLDIFYPKSLLKKLAGQGIDVSNFRPAVTPGGLAAQKARAAVSYHAKWNAKGPHPETGEEVIILPWTFDPNFPEKEYVRNIMNDMNKDTSCVHMLEIDENTITTAYTTYTNGVVVTQDHEGEQGCWSFIGKCAGCGGNPSQYDVPSTWQVLNLSQPGCGYLNDERPVKHEFLHALGFLHEQSRPDRGQFLNVDTSNLSSGWASQFDLMDSSEWLDTSHPYEALSVMHYGSYLGGELVMTYKDGTSFNSNRYMTTTDSLQVDYMYCQDMPQYDTKPKTSCSSTDKFGFNRPVFMDRLCDNIEDCFGGDDEGTIAQCKNAGTNTANGCCEFINIHTYTCQTTSQNDSGKDAYLCVDSNGNEQAGVYYLNGDWIFGPDTTFLSGSSFDWETSNESCPAGVLQNYPVTCVIDGVDESATACNSNPCGANANCFSVNESEFECSCENGFELDASNNCVEIVPEDECTTGTDNCHSDATCTDTEFSFTCECNEGFHGDGVNCYPIPACCKTINLDRGDHYNFICEYAHDTNDGYKAYHCGGNPDVSSSGWINTVDGGLSMVFISWFNGGTYIINTPEHVEGTSINNVLYYANQDSGDSATQTLNKCPDLDRGWTANGVAMTASCDAYFITDPCDGVTCAANSECVASGDASHTCECDDGYTADGDNCVVLVNECLAGTDECDANAFCTDTPLGYGCVCDDGFDGDGFTCAIVCFDGTESNAAGTECVDINECASSTACPDNSSCNNVFGSFECICNDGFAVDGSSGNCVDIDECADNVNECGDNSICENFIGAYHCICSNGYSGDGFTCTDVNECATGVHDCPSHAICENGPGFYTCECSEGFEGAGDECVDIDECARDQHDCDSNANCENVFGSYACACSDGYSGDGHMCLDIDECVEDPCSDDATCTNLDGSYECQCSTGYEGDGITCTDIDECALNQHNCDPDVNACVNNDGSFDCACPPGFEGDGITCTDIDECALDQHNCDMNGVCVDNFGSFTCVCSNGYSGDGVTCFDIDECVQDPCSADATCTNQDGSYECQCSTGFDGDGITCTDIDECAEDPCDDGEVCQNLVGSFKCIQTTTTTTTTTSTTTEPTTTDGYRLCKTGKEEYPASNGVCPDWHKCVLGNEDEYAWDLLGLGLAPFLSPEEKGAGEKYSTYADCDDDHYKANDGRTVRQIYCGCKSSAGCRWLWRDGLERTCIPKSQCDAPVENIHWGREDATVGNRAIGKDSIIFNARFFFTANGIEEDFTDGWSFFVITNHQIRCTKDKWEDCLTSPGADLVGVYQEPDCSTTVMQFQSEDLHGHDNLYFKDGVQGASRTRRYDRNNYHQFTIVMHDIEFWQLGDVSDLSVDGIDEWLNAKAGWMTGRYEDTTYCVGESMSERPPYDTRLPESGGKYENGDWKDMCWSETVRRK